MDDLLRLKLAWVGVAYNSGKLTRKKLNDTIQAVLDSDSPKKDELLGELNKVYNEDLPLW